MYNTPYNRLFVDLIEVWTAESSRLSDSFFTAETSQPLNSSNLSLKRGWVQFKKCGELKLYFYQSVGG